MDRFEDLITEPQFRIRSKILLSFLGLSVTSIIIFGYVALTDIRNLGNYAQESGSSLSESAIKESSKETSGFWM